ncbi:hypothetical protein DSL72_007564 [Monilinia vaccinii-corymbosi]|uniref:Uncharacterized protein n=1 Tax=Monilinia vaccinii-corymbosi TaxID=61207 RepID=A0A8A3PI46_9HELO|nr:hypothetical protein DSL72_007564 [Monilinia vaccinii-corymbosi]
MSAKPPLHESSKIASVKNAGKGIKKRLPPQGYALAALPKRIFAPMPNRYHFILTRLHLSTQPPSRIPNNRLAQLAAPSQITHPPTGACKTSVGHIIQNGQRLYRDDDDDDDDAFVTFKPPLGSAVTTIRTSVYAAIRIEAFAAS